MDLYTQGREDVELERKLLPRKRIVNTG